MTIPESERQNPAWQRVFASLQERIATGVYGPGDWLPTERRLAVEFGTDRSAVRTALIRLADQEMIVREPGHRPRVNRSGKSKAAETRRTFRQTTLQVIAVVLPQHDADLASRAIVRGISQVLHSQETPYRLTIFDTNLPTAPRVVLEQEAWTAIQNEDFAGAVVWPTLEEDSLCGWRQAQDQGHPLTFVDRYDDALPCDFVGVDNYAAAKEAIEYLLQLGHTRIAHLTNDETISSVRNRAAGFRDALRAAGVAVDGNAIRQLPGRNLSDGVEEFADFCLRADLPPTAVFTMNDLLAHMLITRLEERGLRVPQDVSVIGFDDEERFSPRPALLTTVRQPFERIGERAAELLLARISAADARPYQHILLPTTVIERATCHPLEKP